MTWTLSLPWFFAGIAIVALGSAIVFFYRQISDHLARGASSYDKVRLVGIFICLFGFLVMLNLHTFLMNVLVSLIFKV